MTGRWFSPGTPVSSFNKTDRHDIAEILLKVVLNNIKLKQTYINLHIKWTCSYKFHCSSLPSYKITPTVIIKIAQLKRGGGTI
jgi:hypothetical protein